jgi:hypothetical protein
MNMSDQISLLCEINTKLPVDVAEDIYKRVHKRQMADVMKEYQNELKEYAREQIRYEGFMLQEMYNDKAYGFYHTLRYNMLYYLALEVGSGFDNHDICQRRAIHWTEEDDDYFSVFQDLPLLISDDDDLDEFDF